MEDRLKIIIDSIKESRCLTGIAISSAGIIDPLKGKIIYANKNIPNYKGTNLKRILEEEYKLPVTVENDVNSALLGELNYGDYQNVHSALMITIGTGVGGALYLNNQIYHGFLDSAGEIGYSLVDGQNIEAIASTRALVDRVSEKLGDDTIDGRWIFEEAIQHKNLLIIKEINKNKLVREKTKIQFASLGNQAGILGAYIHHKNN